MASSEKTRRNEHKLKYRRFHLKVRKKLSNVKMAKHWHRFPKEVLEPPYLEIFKTQLDTVQSSVL